MKEQLYKKSFRFEDSCGRRRAGHFDKGVGYPGTPAPMDYIDHILSCLLSYHVVNTQTEFNLGIGDSNPSDSNKLSLSVHTGATHKTICIRYPVYKEDFMRHPEFVETRNVHIGSVNLNDHTKNFSIEVLQSNIFELRDKYSRVSDRYFCKREHIDDVKEFIPEYYFEIMARVATVLHNYSVQ
ncbi:MAG: hypothetical protein IKB64_02190 [Paludibacteraceae bacterium]|nr:hypothetical protein [Paludibacteraceae bacterium]